MRSSSRHRVGVASSYRVKGVASAPRLVAVASAEIPTGTQTSGTTHQLVLVSASNASLSKNRSGSEECVGEWTHSLYAGGASEGRR